MEQMVKPCVPTPALCAGVRQDQIGPGRLVLVVGPSGAGKDTLIRGARAACADDRTVVFPQRVITRAPSESEDNAAVSEQSFTQMLADGELALSWDAHGQRYGIPSSLDDDIRAGRTAVCNVSRTIIGRAKRRYAFVTVVLVTAPKEVLRFRLAQRARTDDGDLNARMARVPDGAASYTPDLVINNAGRPEIGVRRLLSVMGESQIFIVC